MPEKTGQLTVRSANGFVLCQQQTFELDGFRSVETGTAYLRKSKRLGHERKHLVASMLSNDSQPDAKTRTLDSFASLNILLVGDCRCIRAVSW